MGSTSIDQKYSETLSLYLSKEIVTVFLLIDYNQNYG
uniref:Uncharacterized protein n=1 Tax=Myoviridae sp. ctCo31 TaxID=2825053 RepID=A0A8S5UMI2_9CAUD|nr:MAG TPA: hypothetical protein [Myoviridae sp. ctCo31]